MAVFQIERELNNGNLECAQYILKHPPQRLSSFDEQLLKQAENLLNQKKG